MRVTAFFRRYSLILLGFVFSCITPYDPDIKSGEPRMVVEGLISNLPGPHQVRITRSAAYSNSSEGANIGISDATVYVTDDQGRKIEYFLAGAGVYVTAPDVRGEVGRSYQVHITLADGSEYVSEPDLLKPVPPIDQIYTEYDRTNKKINVYVDLTDSPTPGDGYLWRWQHYEPLVYCKLSETIPGTNGEKTPCLNCCTTCWDIFQCYTCVNIAGDQYVNGNKVRKQLITAVPYASQTSYYLLIEQRSLSNNAFQFWNSVKVQTSSSGGPFDAAPAPTQGNLKNSNNSKEKVLGFFGASSVVYQPYWVQRDNIDDTPVVPVPPDCPVIVGPPPPCYPCIEEFGRRTGTKPLGWDR